VDLTDSLLGGGTDCNIRTFHSERDFKDPRNWHPERFLAPDHPDYDHIFDNDSKAAFKRFNVGSRGCIGMNMGWMTSRVVIAKLIWHLDWELINSNEIDWERDTRLFTMWVRPKVMVKYTPV
jgi:cytochrome P450